jgi:hypothetical protein
VSEARAGLPGRVDRILAELGVPAEVDADGDWRLDTDVGPFLLVVDGANGDLVAIQTIRRMDRGPEAYAEDMHLLMRLNVDAAGACFAALSERDTNLLVLTARVRADAVSHESVEAMLADARRLSRRLDEVTGKTPARQGPADR